VEKAAGLRRLRPALQDAHSRTRSLGRAKARPYNASYKVLGAGLPSEPPSKKRAFNKRRQTAEKGKTGPSAACGGKALLGMTTYAKRDSSLADSFAGMRPSFVRIN
jgi:hypothetical protein